jgi:cell wall assembly regulator SMI1
VSEPNLATTPWLRYLAALERRRPGATASFRGPASPAELDALAVSLAPVRVPDELRELLLLVNGDTGNPHYGDPDQWWLSTRAIARDYRAALASFGAEPGIRFAPANAVKEDRGWRPGWIPVSRCEGDLHFLDLDPGPSGKIGQVVYWSLQFEPPGVVASSLAEFVSRAADALQ